MNFIGVDNPEIAKERVQIRVLKGGHGIEKDTIERRFYESINNLKVLIPICDEINIYDNTKQIEEIAYIVNGNLKWISEYIPTWMDSILQ